MWFAAVMLGVASVPHSDGGIFTPLWMQVSEPNQRALLWLERGRETLMLSVDHNDSEYRGLH